MSNVRISNGSPTLERMEARQADYPKPSACRSLFGPVDHDELARELRRHRHELEAATRRHWNFDFQRHRPLQGRYEWQALPSDALPDFYSRRPRLSKTPAAPKPGSCCPAPGTVAQEERRSEAAAAAGPRPDAAGQSSGQRKRPASQDTSSRNKRHNMTEEAILEDSPSASSVEQTPKKTSPRRNQT